MKNQRSACSSVLALLLPVTLGLGCGLKRDWNYCSPQDPCKPGYVCTAGFTCVLPGDGGSDALGSVDSHGPSDLSGGGVDGLVSVSADGPGGVGPDGAGSASVSPDAAVSPAPGPDGPEPDRAPVAASPDAPVAPVPDAPSAAGPPDAPSAGGPPDAPAAGPPDAPAVGSPPDTLPADRPDAPVDAPPIGPTVDATGSCSTDKDCSSQSPLCLGNRCAKCSSDNDCTGRTGTLACATSGLCVACTANKHCTGAAGTCDTATNQCVGCVKRSDCGGVCQTCSSGGVCTALKGQDDPGVCAGTCDSTGTCKSKQGQTCQTAGGGCAAGTTCSPDGVCCDRACMGSCETCDILSSLGTCTTLAANATPHAGHTACVAADSTCAGKCNGTSTACSYPPATTACGTASCTGTSYQAAGTCSTGTCSMPPAQTCPSTGCNTATNTCNAPCAAGTTACGAACCAFTSGPCAVSPNLSSVEVFAIGDDHHIHRRVLSGTTWGAWQDIAGLNGSLIDARSDLDCSANTNTIHIVATASSPAGAFMHATGFGTSYNQFSNEIPGSTFSMGVSIGVIQTDTSGGYRRAEVLVGSPGIQDVTPGYTPGELSIPLVNQFVSSPDLAYQVGMNSSHTYLVGHDTSAQLALYHYVTSASPSSWWPPVLIAPPVTKTYSFSPTICTESNNTASVFTRHIAAVAGGKLWYSNEVGWGAGYSAWEQMGSVDVASSPDCTVTGDSTVHVVALSTAGTAVDVHGKSGSWTTTDLGVY